MRESRLLRLSLAGLAVAALPALASAQRATPATDSLFLRAQRLVNEGDAGVGRRLVDSLYRAAPSGSSRQAEALYWRAALAATAAEAERDYRRLTVEFPLSPRSEDALITLAQLEMTRREYPQAIRHLERLVQDHPQSASVPRAHFWLARVHLEQGDLPRGCASLASARSTTPRTNVELHNQIDFHSRRCLGVDTGAAAARDSTVVAARTSSPDLPTTLPAGPPASATAASAPPPEWPPATTTPRRDSAVPPAPSASAPASGTQFTVQVAALNTRAQADELRDKLRARGLDARVVGAGQLFRVRIGRYPTRDAAAKVAADLKQRGISRDAWVAEAEAR